MLGISKGETAQPLFAHQQGSEGSEMNKNR